MDVASTAEGRPSHDTDRNGNNAESQDDERGNSYSEIVANGQLTVGDGDNKFQRAIAAWRSQSFGWIIIAAEP